MFSRTIIAIALLAGTLGGGVASAQVSQRGQAASPGQSRASNRLPQPPSGGVATGLPAAGPQTEQDRQADAEAKKAVQICKGC